VAVLAAVPGVGDGGRGGKGRDRGTGKRGGTDGRAKRAVFPLYWLRRRIVVEDVDLLTREMFLRSCIAEKGCFSSASLKVMA
jgi:hypothetical protein